MLWRRGEEILQFVDKTERELVEQEEQMEGKITIFAFSIASATHCKGTETALNDRGVVAGSLIRKEND